MVGDLVVCWQRIESFTFIARFFPRCEVLRFARFRATFEDKVSGAFPVGVFHEFAQRPIVKQLKLKTLARKGTGCTGSVPIWFKTSMKTQRTVPVPLSRGLYSTRLARRESGTGTKAASTSITRRKPNALTWSQSHFLNSLFSLSKQQIVCECQICAIGLISLNKSVHGRQATYISASRAP